MVVTLSRLDDSDLATPVGHGVTNAEGRISDLLPLDRAEPGVYRLTYETTAYFAHSHRESIYPRIEITFRVTEASEPHHVPLLLSPYGYTTYRGDSSA